MTKTYALIDSWYYETVPNGSLKQGSLTTGGSISSDWSSVGENSIKIDLSSVNWCAYRIANPVMEKKGKLELDYSTTNTSSTITIVLTIGGTDRSINSRIDGTDNTTSIPFDFSEYEGTITRLDIRGAKYSTYTNPLYLDNIRIYSA